MSKVYFISDLHLGHDCGQTWAKDFREGDTVAETDQWMIDQWNRVVRKRDTVYVCGDVCFDLKSLPLMDKMYGQKKLILGNHDIFPLAEYQKYFTQVLAYARYKKHWISHMPLDPYDILDGRVEGNIHGHLHQNNTDKWYHYNACVEQCHGVPVNFEHIRDNIQIRKQMEEERQNDT